MGPVLNEMGVLLRLDIAKHEYLMPSLPQTLLVRLAFRNLRAQRPGKVWRKEHVKKVIRSGNTYANWTKIIPWILTWHTSKQWGNWISTVETTSVLELDSSCGIASIRETWTYWESPAKHHWGIKGLGHFSWEARFRNLRLFSWEKRWSRRESY